MCEEPLAVSRRLCLCCLPDSVQLAVHCISEAACIDDESNLELMNGRRMGLFFAFRRQEGHCVAVVLVELAFEY